MCGGHFLQTRAVALKLATALRPAAVAMLAVQFALGSSALPLSSIARADHDASQDCEAVGPSEQSIVISAKKLSDGNSELKASSESSADGGALQPIANVSERVPDLADPIFVAQVPTLAEPVEVEVSEATAIESEPTPEKSEADAEPAVKQKPLAAMAEIEVVSFHGITPGTSTRINVLRTWGDPRSDDTQAAMLKYRFDDLPAVKVHFEDNLVESIVVELAEPTSAAKLTQRLELQHVRPVVMKDADGTAIAREFPERGVTMRYAVEELGLAIVSDSESTTNTSPRIGSIVIRPIEASPFLLRAETSLKSNYTYAIADLEAALRIDHTLCDARLRLAEIYAKTGKVLTAERQAAKAVELEPQNVAARLQLAKNLRQLARYDRAVEEVRVVLETPNIEPLIRAQSLNEMGLLASLGSQKVARRAMPLHAKAIEIADRLAIGDDPLVRLPAKQLLVEAHLAVAVEISLGAWQQKDESVPQWIERSSALAEALIAEDESYLPLRLQVAVSSLAAAANLDEPINPLLWIEEAEDTAAEIKTRAFDPLVVSQYDWQLGLAYFHGSQIEHRRSEAESAIRLGELADEQLAELSLDRDEMPDTAYLMGRLYFQVGAVHAVHYEDHATACLWYDEAVERLLNPVPVTTMAVPQQHGDALVSMGVSYWGQGDRQRAIEVTQAGVELIEEAVSTGLLESDTLKVSYNNLSAMHQAQGDEEPAARYERLAKQVTGAKLSQKPSRTSTTQRR